MNMVEQFCHYCQQRLKKINEKYCCPIHGVVLIEKPEEENKDKKKDYIG